MGYTITDGRELVSLFRRLAEANRQQIDNGEAYNDDVQTGCAIAYEDAANHIEQAVVPSAEERAEVVEDLASVEHGQWRYWAENIAAEEDLSEERRERWESLFVPYQELPEDEKESDREWAREVLSVLEGEGE